MRRADGVLVLSLFLAGGLAGLLYDQIHVRGGVIHYADPLLFGQPWWVGPQYGLATATAVLAGRRFVPARPSTGRTVVAAGCFLAAYCATAGFNAFAVPLAAALVAVWLAQLLARPAAEQMRAALFCVAVAVVGTSYEAVLTSTGAFRHRRPDVLGVPYWLPALYLLGGLLALAVSPSVTRDRPSSSPSASPRPGVR